MSKTNIDNFNENRARISATATTLLLLLMLLLSMPLLMFPKIVVATDGSDEEDPVKIYYEGTAYSSPDKAASITVCSGQPLEITVQVVWFQPPDPSKVKYVSVQMVEISNLGVTFNPGSFNLYNPDSLSIDVTVTVPALPPGTYTLQIYANVIAQGPQNTPKVAGTNAYFQLNVISCSEQAKICGFKFYDANANGVWDDDEPAIEGFKIELYDADNNLIATTFTGSDGSYCFDGLEAGTYTVKEVLPPDSWIPTTSTSITVTLQSGDISEDNNFGNLCLEPGQGGKTIGYWANAGNSLITDDDREYLNDLNLFKPNGWSYPPFSNNQQIKNYLLKANAKNMKWMLSAQLIATVLNVRHGYLDGSTLVCIDPDTCSTFMSIDDIINGAIGALDSDVKSEQEYWKNLLDNLNNNKLPFVSPEPCPVEYPEEEVGNLAFPILPASYLLILLSLITAASIYYRQLLMEYYADFITKIRRTLISCINLLVPQS